MKYFLLIALLIFGASRAFAFIQAGTIQAGTIQLSGAATTVSNNLLLENGSYVLLETSDKLVLES